MVGILREWVNAVLGARRRPAVCRGRGAWLSTTVEGPLAVLGVGIGRDGPALFRSVPQPTWALVLMTPDKEQVTLDPVTNKLTGSVALTHLWHFGRPFRPKTSLFCGSGTGGSSQVNDLVIPAFV